MASWRVPTQKRAIISGKPAENGHLSTREQTKSSQVYKSRNKSVYLREYLDVKSSYDRYTSIRRVTDRTGMTTRDAVFRAAQARPDPPGRQARGSHRESWSETRGAPEGVPPRGHCVTHIHRRAPSWSLW